MNPLEDIFNDMMAGQNCKEFEPEDIDLLRIIFMTGATAPLWVLEKHGLQGMIAAKKEIDDFRTMMVRKATERN